MDDLASADVDTYVTGVAYDVTGLCIGKSTGNGVAHTTVSTGGMRKRYTEVSVYAHYESGAVGTVCKRRTAVNIRVTHKLESKVGN